MNHCVWIISLQDSTIKTHFLLWIQAADDDAEKSKLADGDKNKESEPTAGENAAGTKNNDPKESQSDTGAKVCGIDNL